MGGLRGLGGSAVAQQQGARGDRGYRSLGFETSKGWSLARPAALEWAQAIAWDPALAADDLWERLHEHFTEPQLVELGHFIALTLGQQRFLKTVGIKHGEVLADTVAGLAPAEAERLRQQRA